MLCFSWTRWRVTTSATTRCRTGCGGAARCVPCRPTSSRFSPNTSSCTIREPTPCARAQERRRFAPRVDMRVSFHVWLPRVFQKTKREQENVARSQVFRWDILVWFVIGLVWIFHFKNTASGFSSVARFLLSRWRCRARMCPDILLARGRKPTNFMGGQGAEATVLEPSANLLVFRLHPILAYFLPRATRIRVFLVSDLVFCSF